MRGIANAVGGMVDARAREMQTRATPEAITVTHDISTRWRWMSACGWVLLCLAVPAHGLQDKAAFQGAVDLVALNVTLTDQRHEILGGLGADDFAVFEDGVPQELSFFAAGRIPLDLAILLDTSSSMSEVLATAQAAAIGFVETAIEGDRVSVIEFNNGANIVHPLDGDLTLAAGVIRRTKAHGSTALYNGLYMAMTEMVRSRRTTKEVRRQAIVVLSDGHDTASLVQYEDVMALARESGIILYTITLLSNFEARQLLYTKNKAYSQPQFIMRSFAQDTGGLAFMTHDARELDGIYGKIANELAQQYTLGYVSKNSKRDGAFRRIDVRVLNRPGVLARTRSGYQAPKSRPGGLTR
jgi:VWFA-related protein